MEDNKGIANESKEFKKQEEQTNTEALKISIFVSDTMAIRAGRDFVWHLLENYRVFDDGFSENPIVLARNTGVRGAGLLLLNLILSECPDRYELMFAEHKYKEKNDD